jgi:hypothetical protein
MSIGHRMPETQSLMPFEYGLLDPETRIVVQQKTGEIKDRIKRSAQDMVEIGERLIDIKARLGHGRFLSWLEAEFDWSVRTADNLMGVAEAFKFADFANLTIGKSALVALASPSVPEEARQEAVSLAENGLHVTHSEAKRIIADHKPRPASQPEHDDDGGESEPPVLWAEEPGLPEESASAEEAEAHSVEWEARWAEFLASKSRFLVSLPRRGGIVYLTRNWSRKGINGAITELERLGKVALKCAAELREARK